MAVLTVSQRSILPALVILRVEIVALTLATAAIHASLGGTLFLLNALNAQLSAKNALISVWVGYETARMSLYRDLDLMFLDARGNWINERDPLVAERRPEPAVLDLGPRRP